MCGRIAHIKNPMIRGRCLRFDFVTIADRSTKLRAALRLSANCKRDGRGLGEWR